MTDYSTIAAARQRFFGRLNVAVVLECIGIGFAGTYADDLIEVVDKDLAVTDLAAIGRMRDRFDDALGKIVGHRDLELDLGQEIDHILRAAIQLGMALLPAETLDLGNGDALHADFGERFAHIVELERLDDGHHHFHYRGSAGGSKNYTRTRHRLPAVRNFLQCNR